MFAEIDYAKWPVVVITYNHVKGSKFKELFNNFKLEFMKILEKASNNGEKCILIYNLNKIQHFNINHGIIEMEFQKKIRKVVKSNVAITYLVSKDRMLRDAVKMFIKMQYPKDKYYFNKTVDHVLDSLLSEIERAKKAS